MAIATPQTRPLRPSDRSSIGDGAVLERLKLMRNACQALAFELADTRRQLRAAEAELERLTKPRAAR